MRIFLAVMLTILAAKALGQADKKLIKQQAELTGAALLNDDYETLIKFTYPKVIEIVGGRDKLIAMVQKGKVEMKSQGITFEKVIIGEPSSSVAAGSEIHCLVPQTVFLKVPNGKMKSESYLIGVSQDGGSHWFFIDAVNLNMGNVRTVLPNYNSDLQLPAKKQPQFIKD